ncbi:MAG: Bro-N domain-containing protein [Devosia sp.]
MEKGKDAVLVPESGLYKLTMRSDKAEARPFQDWVTREVLPAIRKTGWGAI